MISHFLEIAYNYYPKGISFLTDKMEVNENYTGSKENRLLNQERNNYFGQDAKFGEQIIDSLFKNGNDIEFRDVSRISSGDRAFCIQHSGFFFKEDLKYYPLCFAFSGIIPYFYSYFVDIDISFDEPIKIGSYQWKKNNGIFFDWKEKPSFVYVERNISKIISTSLGFKKFPEQLIMKTIPGIGNNNIENGNFTFFNAFFLDDFYCFP